LIYKRFADNFVDTAAVFVCGGNNNSVRTGIVAINIVVGDRLLASVAVFDLMNTVFIPSISGEMVKRFVNFFVGKGFYNIPRLRGFLPDDIFHVCNFDIGFLQIAEKFTGSYRLKLLLSRWLGWA